MQTNHSSNKNPSFDEIYKTHYKAVRATIKRYRFRDAAADDLIQDIFFHAWKKLDQLQNPAAFSSWLMTMTKNFCISELRRRKSTTALSNTDISSDSKAKQAESILIAHDIFASLRFEHSLTLLREMISTHESEPRATVARMFYLEEKPIKGISAHMGINQNTILSHLRRFRLIISQAMLNLVEERQIEAF